jgi:hypothetical protein
VPQWASLLGIAPNTLHNWRKKKGLEAQYRGNRALIAPATLRDFLVHNPQLSAAPRALHRLESAERVAPHTAGNDAHGGTPGPSHPEAMVRDELRALRAKVATLDDELERSRAESVRFRAQRDTWRERARVHRQALRGQLDLEEALDAANIDD